MKLFRENLDVVYYDYKYQKAKGGRSMIVSMNEQGEMGKFAPLIYFAEIVAAKEEVVENMVRKLREKLAKLVDCGYSWANLGVSLADYDIAFESLLKEASNYIAIEMETKRKRVR